MVRGGNEQVAAPRPGWSRCIPDWWQDAAPMSQPPPPRVELEALEQVALWGDMDPGPYAALEGAAAAGRAPPRARHLRLATFLRRAGYAVAALWVFLISLQLLKDGARGLAPVMGGAVESLPNAVGLGWLGALLVLSGSPVAASSMALLESGFLSVDEAYGAVVGSRLGAAFVVLVIGTLYALRGRSAGRRAPISIGVLALLMTLVAYVPGAAIGLALLQSGLVSGVVLVPPPLFFDITDALTAAPVGAVESVISPNDLGGAALLFVVGLVTLLVSFRLVDGALPSFGQGGADERARWYVGPWSMFAIGLLVALATLSVSVALSLLVPAVAKGYLRREQILPYIGGANITTLADTLVVAILTGNQDAPRIVLAVAVGVTLSTVAVLAIVYRPMRRLVFGLSGWVLVSRSRLAGFVAVLFACPIALMILFR
jgi:sodium-dependent phosphate cotransporter